MYFLSLCYASFITIYYVLLFISIHDFCFTQFVLITFITHTQLLSVPHSSPTQPYVPFILKKGSKCITIIFKVAHLFYKERGEGVMEIDRWGDRKDLGGVGGGETVIRICYMKNCFSTTDLLHIQYGFEFSIFLLDY